MAKSADTPPQGRIKSLTIRNFRAIGPEAVKVEIDDIVILVGPNNAGKSSILRAYEKVMRGSGKDAALTLSDFPNERVDTENLPSVVVETVVKSSDGVGERWVDSSEGELVVRERFEWSTPNLAPIILGYLPNAEDGPRWATTDDSPARPFGAPNVAKSRRPQPLSVHAFQKPEEQAAEVDKVAREILKQKAKVLKYDENDEKTAFETVLETVEYYHDQVAEQSKFDIDQLSLQLTDIVEKVFPGCRVEFKPKAELEKFDSDFILKNSGTLYMGSGDEMLPISHQGSGAQRTLLWAALKVLTEFGPAKSERPFLLLIDEPELCLHPSAIREARETLYGLAEEQDWQVMVTTHSPAFIDFSRAHTKVARIERRDDGTVSGTTVFRPEANAFDEDDRTNFKLLNLCDPNVAEFFFGGPIILVEGDTEYSAFNLVVELSDQVLPRAHIVRARGKATLASLAKILNQFGSAYAVLHDSDLPLTKKGKASPAWTINQNIKDAIDAAPDPSRVRLVASITNFENAYLGCETRSDKPYNAVNQLMSDDQTKTKILNLYKSLVDFSHPLPFGALEWSDLSELEKQVS